eukprot:15462407-Alexandrium_andersonii.AAC.1
MQRDGRRGLLFLDQAYMSSPRCCDFKTFWRCPPLGASSDTHHSGAPFEQLRLKQLHSKQLHLKQLRLDIHFWPDGHILSALSARLPPLRGCQGGGG